MDSAQIERLRGALEERNVEMEYFENGAQALARLIELVPLGTEVQTGSSTTLDQIGFTAWLSARHKEGSLRYFRAEGLTNDDPGVRHENRRQGCLAEYFLGSVNALTESGIAVAADAAGTRVGGYVYPARRVIWVVGVNKIVPDLDAAVKRVFEVALPGEDERVRRVYGSTGSEVGKMVFFYREGQRGRIRMLLVGEALGF
jgi:hypothetical protein